MYNIIAFFALFIAGFFAGKLTTDNNWHKKQEYQQKLYIEKLAIINQQNNYLIESYTLLKTNYNNIVQEKLNVLQENKDLINRNNVITRRFVQYTTLHPNQMHKDNSESVIDSDTRISAVRYGEWIIGLESHDYQCVNQLNLLIKSINNQED